MFFSSGSLIYMNLDEAKLNLYLHVVLTSSKSQHLSTSFHGLFFNNLRHILETFTDCLIGTFAYYLKYAFVCLCAVRRAQRDY